jgi:hypothetical protein
MLLRHDVIQIFHLPDGDGGTMLVMVIPASGGMGLAPINGDRLGRAMAADGLGEEAPSGSLASVLSEQEVTRLPRLIDSAIQVGPLAFDLTDQTVMI